ncbi:MAG: hypothetical protein Q7R41_19685 [Phycisphaerales bacterium]|nr:hypothetical protein [Phycisphaerales bacterium]
MEPVDVMDAEEANPCPKRVWVLTTLADDEALGADGLLPPGLQFHLSRCPSCRSEADRLRSVSDVLCKLSTIEPPVELFKRADEQLAIALAHGAVPSGRVTIPDDDGANFDAPQVRATALRFIGQFAAAAVLVFAVGWAGLAVLERNVVRTFVTQPTERSDSPPRRVRTFNPATEISQPAAGATDAVAAREAEQPQRPYCTALPYFDSSVPDDANCIQRAFSLPVRGRRDLAWQPPIQRLDNTPAPVSTTRLPSER